MKLLRTEAAWKEYCNWQNQDKKILKKLNEIIKDDAIEILACKNHY